MIKAVKVELEGNFLNLIFQKSTRSLKLVSYLIMRKRTLHSKSTNKTSMSFLIAPIRNYTVSPSWCNKTKEEIKHIQIRMEEIKLPLLVDDMIIYVENA